MIMLFRIRAIAKAYIKPIAQYLSFKHSHPIKCNESTCGHKSYSFRAVNVLNLLLLLIGTIILYFVMKELWTILAFPVGVAILTLTSPERCPRCKSTNVSRIELPELNEYIKLREEEALANREEQTEQ